MSAADRFFRICLVVATAIGGFFFTPLFLLAGFVAWTILKGTGAPQPLAGDPRNGAGPQRGVPTTVSAATPDLEKQFMAQCDSPAEKGFLAAMIRAWQLIPNRGALCGNNLTLRLQVQAWYYRLDFLVNDWLVVEIDGAAYHSSQAAVQHDCTRDGFFAQRGYTTLRIPASVVFRSPDEAVRRVQQKLQAGNPKCRPHKSLWQETREVIAASVNALDALSRE
ncbi:MAG TPA: DUF559 domain-containing protein, partial [Oleiagrimonas sp.]|nr:DUF559 domain-containing protein [Oleiagrimonas sp.]